LSDLLESAFLAHRCDERGEVIQELIDVFVFEYHKRHLVLGEILFRLEFEDVFDELNEFLHDDGRNIVTTEAGDDGWQ